MIMREYMNSIKEGPFHYGNGPQMLLLEETEGADQQVHYVLESYKRDLSAEEKRLKESNFDQLYAYLKQHEVHANENIIMMERFRSSSTENLIESLSNSLALLTQSYKSHLLKQTINLERRLMQGTKLWFKTGKFVVEDAVGRDNANNQGRPFQRNNAKKWCETEGPITRDHVPVDKSAQRRSNPTMNPGDIIGLKILLPEYVEDNEDHVVQRNVSFVRNDALMSILDEMHEQGELVGEYEKRAKFELTDRERKIDEQMRIIISDQNRKETSLKSELHSAQILLSSTVDHYKSKTEEVTLLKKDFKQKEDKFLEEFLDIKKLKDKIEDRLYKQDQSVQTIHMLCKPKSSYDEKHKVAIGYKNPVCLARAKQAQSALYNGHVLVTTNHTPTVIHDSEDTRVNDSTEASESKPRSNTKKNRILPAKKENKKEVEVYLRTNNHEMCVVNILNSVNATSTVKIVLNKGKQIWKPKGRLSDNSLYKTKRVWKATGKLFIDIGYQWRPTGKKLALGKLDCGYQWRPTGKTFALGEMCHLTKLSVKCRTGHALVSGLRLFKTYDGESFKAHEFCGKVHRCNLKSILCGGTWTQSILCRQFSDSDLEVAFRKHTCFVHDNKGTDILKGSRSTNLYTISIDEMMKSSPICLLSKASKSKSWLWHRRLNHLNFGTINDLARKDLVRGLAPTDKELEMLFQPIFDEHLEQSRVNDPVPSATEINAQVVPTGTSLSTTIAQDAPSTSASSSTSDIHHPCNISHFRVIVRLY
ncbi:integrase, catalytic region, zinc finger, CCHC-type containing protein [Tanacetum coccineum]